jgi:hypothetical protein
MLLYAVHVEAQKRPDSKISITHSYTIKRMESVKSILFVYEGDAWLTRKYVNLSKRLKSRYKKKYELGFHYKLDVKNGYEEELGYIPRETNQNIKPDLICKLKSYGLKRKKEKYTEEFSYTYKMKFEMIDPATDGLVEFAELELFSYHTPYDNNKALVRLLDKIITE